MNNRAKRNRRRAIDIAGRNAIAEIPQRRRIWFPNSNECLPFLLFHSGVYALWAKTTPPPPLPSKPHAELGLQTIQPQRECVWKTVGGQAADVGLEYTRKDLVDKNGVKVIQTYQYKTASPSNWFVIQVENPLEADAGEEDVEEEEEEMDLEPLEMTTGHSTALPKMYTKLQVTESFQAGKISNDPEIHDQIFRNVTIIGRLIVVSDESMLEKTG
jgi:hypothetical protein